MSQVREVVKETNRNSNQEKQSLKFQNSVSRLYSKLNKPKVKVSELERDTRKLSRVKQRKLGQNMEKLLRDTKKNRRSFKVF